MERTTELLERDKLLQLLGDHVDAARDGQGSILFIAGEAGAGKTSLVREASRRLRETAVVLEGACDSLTTPRPLSPLIDFAADPDAGLQGLASGLDPGEAFGAVLEILHGRLRPVFMVIEDIHWADEGTLDFLRFVGRRVAEQGDKFTGSLAYRLADFYCDKYAESVFHGNLFEHVCKLFLSQREMGVDYKNFLYAATANLSHRSFSA